MKTLFSFCVRLSVSFFVKKIDFSRSFLLFVSTYSFSCQFYIFSRFIFVSTNENWFFCSNVSELLGGEKKNLVHRSIIKTEAENVNLSLCLFEKALLVRPMCLAAHQWTIRALTPRSSFSLITINSFNLPKLISHPKINNAQLPSDFIYTQQNPILSCGGRLRMSRIFFPRASTVCVGISWISLEAVHFLIFPRGSRS